MNHEIKNGQLPDGRLRGVGEGYTAWRHRAGVRGRRDLVGPGHPGRSSGGCGVTASDGSTQLAATVDRDAGTGDIGWFTRLGITAQLDFTVPVGASGDLTLVDDHGVLAVLIGGRRVATVGDTLIGTPTVRRSWS